MQGGEAMNIIKLVVVAAWLSFGYGAAQAATGCSIGSVVGMNIPSYVEGVAATPQLMSVTVNCTRDSHPADPSTVNYTLTFDTGLNSNRAKATVSGTNHYITYSKGTASSCTPALTTSPGTFTWSGKTKTGLNTATVSFYGCVGAQSGMAAATYTDSIGLVLTDDLGSAPVIGSVPVSITMDSKCTVSTPPGTMTFNYTAFRPTALVVPVGFGVTCTNTTPYTFALDVSNGVAAGLAYSLALSAPGGTGNGSEQTYNVTGTMAAGQAGDCSATCTGTSTHNITVSY
jgi:spore coat protein U-like protein